MVPVDQYSRDCAEEFGSFLAELASAQTVLIPWEQRDTVLIIDNWRMLHARPDASSHLSRRLERALVATTH
jgi:alpha-ketoglutarate-dependent taurine dioxygenase